MAQQLLYGAGLGIYKNYSSLEKIQLIRTLLAVPQEMSNEVPPREVEQRSTDL